MDSLQIPPEYCLIARAFGRTKSLREAAMYLQCDPAALVRKAQRMAHEFGLMQKIKGRWVLTERGLRATQWLEESIALQKSIMSEKPVIRMTTAMWMAEQVLIPRLEQLNIETLDCFDWSIRSVSADFEADLISAASDFVIACHPPSDPVVVHRRLLPEKWVVIVPASWKRAASTKNELEILRQRPFIRHASFNPASAIDVEFEINSQNVLFDNLISVRSAVEAGLGWSCVPELLVRSSLKNNLVLKLNIPPKITGEICLWWLRARKDAEKNSKAIVRWLTESCS